ncbi:sensor histidine kinase [Propionibacteriaceae bacterium Y1923]
MLLWSTDPMLSSWTVVVVVTLAVVASTAAYIAVGLFIGARRDLLAGMKERAETAEREQELRVLQGQAVERNRIAREMHDVLAHRMSLVSLHAGALAYRTDLTPEQMRETAATIRDNAHASLAELRTVLGSLRDGSEVGVLEKPQPADLAVEDLVAEARAGGAVVDFVDELDRTSPLPSAIARHGYRVVQEALTNARKHAPGGRVDLRLSGAPGSGLVIRVANPLRATSPSVPGSGLGLVGLRERVDLSGGRMAVRTQDGRFEVEVWLPW